MSPALRAAIAIVLRAAAADAIRAPGAGPLGGLEDSGVFLSAAATRSAEERLANSSLLRLPAAIGAVAATADFGTSNTTVACDTLLLVEHVRGRGPVAATADEVVLVVAGQPLKVKG